MRYRATIAYIGTRFHGWQVQANASRTVQAVVQEALEQLAHEPVRLEGAGRTDAGVHAEGQVAHFDLTRSREPRVIRDAVNRRLPEDVRILDVAPVPDAFHARFDVEWKEYRYRWSRAAVIPPRDAPFLTPISAAADAGRMREAAQGLAGTRDFGIFAVRTATEEPGIRTLHFVTIDERGDELSALFRGDGFLRGMVRSICGVLADAARGRVEPSRMEELLSGGDRRLLSPKAPARGLTLVRVSYEDGGGS